MKPYYYVAMCVMKQTGEDGAPSTTREVMHYELLRAPTQDKEKTDALLQRLVTLAAAAAAL